MCRSPRDEHLAPLTLVRLLIRAHPQNHALKMTRFYNPANIYGELSIVLKSNGVQQRLASLGYETEGIGMPPAEFDAFFRANLAKWTKAITELNIGAQ